LNFEPPQGFERSEAIEPFDRTQGKLLERLELAICICEGRLHGLSSDLRLSGFVLAATKPTAYQSTVETLDDDLHH
jgi:hypothetical protein